MTQNYIERCWRDAKPEDAIKEPPMVARFRDKSTRQWSGVQELRGWVRKTCYGWVGENGVWEHCQVYDAPDPGEGWRLLDIDKDTKQEGDEYLHPDGTWKKADKAPFSKIRPYRRRITPTVTYVPFTWEDRDQLRGRWITWKHENGLMIESQIDHLNEHKDGGLWFKSHDAKWLLENAKFIDTGKPVGKEVVQ